MARELITSKSRGFSLPKGSYGLRAPKGFSTSLNDYVNLPTQLAFNRGEIPGTTYKDIVAQALERAIPGTTAYNALLKEESQAISRIKSEAEKALEEGRKLRRLQAEAKVALTPGSTGNDALNIYNFWIDEANKASEDGDAEYMAIALRNAGNARDLAEKRYQVESNKAEAAGKKATNAALKEVYNEWQTEDSAYKKGLREIERLYQTGVNSGSESDNLLYQLNAVYAAKVDDRKRYLGELAAADINSMGGKDVQTLIENYSTVLDGKTDASGNQTSPGLVEVVNKLGDRVANARNFVDIVEPKLEKGYPTGEYEVIRKDRGAISSVDPDSGVFIRDDFGRYIFLNKEDQDNGKAIYSGFTIAPDGSILQLRTNEVDPTKQQGAAGLRIFVGDSDQEVNSYAGFIGNQAADQYNIFGKQSDDNFLKEEMKLNQDQIEQGRQLTQRLKEESNKSLFQKTLDTVSTEGYNALKGANKINKLITQQPFSLGSDAVANNPNVPGSVTQEQFNAAIQKPQQVLPKQIAPAPAPKVTAPAVKSTPVTPTYTPTASVIAPPQSTASIKVPAKAKPGPINLGNATISDPIAEATKALRGTAYGGDNYVDQNEYNKAVAKYGKATVDQAFNSGGFKPYGGLKR